MNVMMTRAAEADKVICAISNIWVGRAAYSLDDTVMDIMCGAKAALALVLVSLKCLVPRRLPAPHTSPYLPGLPSHLQW